MANKAEYIQKLENKLNRAKALLVDLDGTLVSSDYANYLSYKRAIEQVISSNVDFSYDTAVRITRDVVRDAFPDLSQDDIDQVVEKKENLYHLYLSETKLNKAIDEILDKYSSKEIVLVTNSRRERAVMLLTYHNVIDKFTHKYYKDDIGSANKFQYVLSLLHMSSDSVILFENSKSEIDQAVSLGISPTNIIEV